MKTQPQVNGGVREKIIHELISGQSALNMPPCKIENAAGEFLSEQDKWANIAYEHILNAMNLLVNET